MGGEALVDGQQALGADRLHQTVEGTFVLVPGLVVHSAHDGVGRVHYTADNETAGGRASEVQANALLQTQVLLQAALGEEVGRQLDGAAEASADHGGADAAVEAQKAFCSVYGAEAVPGVAVAVLGADGKGEMTNYRVQQQTYIVDRLFDRAQLILGAGKKAQKVEISREQQPKG